MENKIKAAVVCAILFISGCTAGMSINSTLNINVIKGK